MHECKNTTVEKNINRYILFLELIARRNGEQILGKINFLQ